MGESVARLSLALKAALLQPHLRRQDNELRGSEALSADSLRALQRARTMELVRYAFDHTTFYRDRYTSAGFQRSDLNDFDVFDQLPILEKADLRHSLDELTVPGVPDRLRLPSSTGGSTGEPLTVFHDKRAPAAAMWWRVYRWWGVHPSANKAFIQRERRSAGARLRERVEWAPTVQLFLDARQMTDSSMAAFTEQWNAHRPALLNGYVGGVHEYAEFVHRSSLAVSRPEAIGVTAAPITRSQRTFIEEVFRAPVYDQYRSAEVPWIAAECRARDGLHVLADLRVVEIVDDGGRIAPPEVEGDVVVTDLANRVFPIIRYRLGDRSALLDSACACPLPFPRMAAIKGRISDVLRLPDGQRVTGGLTGLFNSRPDAVRQFQVHQHDDFSITLRCVSGTAPDSAAVIARAADELAVVVARSVPVRVEFVEAIRHDRGKSRVVLSDLPPVP